MPTSPDTPPSRQSGSLTGQFDGRSRKYQQWRTIRLRSAEQIKATALAFLDIPENLPAGDHRLATLVEHVMQHGFALYQLDSDSACSESGTRTRVTNFYNAMGMTETDSGIITGPDHLSLLENSQDTQRRRFVPYSNRAMNWHTDGYYNTHRETVRSFCLHCIQPALQGGELALMDPQLLLIALYDTDPALVTALSTPDAMMIPASKDDQGHDRPDRTAAVFSTDEQNQLITRFTTRQQNIEWVSTNARDAALTAIELINSNTQWHVRVRLEANQGIVTRNVLHRRTAFEDGNENQTRKMLRGRYVQLPTASKATNQEADGPGHVKSK